MELRQMGGEPMRRPPSIDQADKKQLHVEELSGLSPEQWRAIHENLKNALTHKNFVQKYFGHDDAPSAQQMNENYSGSSGRMFEVREQGMAVGFLAIRITEHDAVIEHVRVEKMDGDVIRLLLEHALRFASDQNMNVSIRVHEHADDVTRALQEQDFKEISRGNGIITFERTK